MTAPRALYHFEKSPFSRRTRLALALKGLEVELREARQNGAYREEAARLVPFRTIPVLVDGAHAMGDSTAITHWLDRAYPQGPRLWPDGAESADALQAAALVDVVLNGVIDLGTRYHALREDPAWPKVKGEMLGRAMQAAESLAALASRVGRGTILPSGWSAVDMWLFTMTDWFVGLPARAASNANVAQVLTLGFTLPRPLPAWADAHRGREDVRALG